MKTFSWSQVFSKKKDDKPTEAKVATPEPATPAPPKATEVAPANAVPVPVDVHKQKRVLSAWYLLLAPMAVLAGVAAHGNALGLLAALGGFFKGYNQGKMNLAAMKYREAQDNLQQLRLNLEKQRLDMMRIIEDRKLSLLEKRYALLQYAQEHKIAGLQNSPSVTQFANYLAHLGQRVIPTLAQMEKNGILLSSYEKIVRGMTGKPAFEFMQSAARNWLRKNYPQHADDPYVIDSLIQSGLSVLPSSELDTIYSGIRQAPSPRDVEGFADGKLPRSYAAKEEEVHKAFADGMNAYLKAAKTQQEATPPQEEATPQTSETPPTGAPTPEGVMTPQQTQEVDRMDAETRGDVDAVLERSLFDTGR